jgi:HNH endonuclease
MRANFWWVNHSHTSQQEVEGSYLWFPSRSRKSKARSESEKNIQRLLPGDIVFSFANGYVGAIGVVLASARDAVKPLEFASVEEYAEATSGWLAPVRFMPVANPLSAQDRIGVLAPLQPRKHAPLLNSGLRNQHVALAAVPEQMVDALSGLLSGEVERIVGTIVESVGRSLAEDATEAALNQRTDISASQKLDLLRARHGQGIFRTNLERNEHSCRITGALDRRHLWARHIKPWSESDDAEKLDGKNGLMMSPHVAHLFERGYISFSDDGDLLVSQELNPVVLENWRISLPLNVGQFSPEQCYFLDYHRREVFQQHGTGRRQKTLESFEVMPLDSPAVPAVVQPA